MSSRGRPALDRVLGEDEAMNCPGCNAEPEELDGDDEQLRVCKDCGGLRIGLSDLNQLLLHHNLPGFGSLGGRKMPDPGQAVCRKCLVDMTHFEGGTRADPMHYELCEECGCTFIDGESVVADDLESARTGLIAFFRKFTSTSSKQG